MVVAFAGCELLEVNDFESQKGTRCGVLRWFDRMEHRVYRCMCFGEDVNMLHGYRRGDVVDLVFEVAPNRRDDSIALVLQSVNMSEVV